MKILCLIDGLSSGGAQRQLVGLADLLNKRGYDVLFVWYHESNFYEQYLIDHHVPYQQFKPSGKWGKIFCVYNVIKTWKPDAVVAFIDGPTMMTSAFKLFGMKAKLIVSERNVVQAINRHQKFKYFMYRWTDYIVSNAQVQTNLINNNFPRLSFKTVTIRNFVDTNFFCPTDQSEKCDIIEMLVIGRLARQKNMTTFLRSIRKVVEVDVKIHVKWFGNQNEQQKDYIEETFKLHQELHLEGFVDFAPPTLDVLSEYRKCTVFCLPSLYEGFPNVVCEAMSCGKPILCSNVSDNAFIVHDGENGLLFDPKSVDDIADKIIRFCQMDDSIKKQMGAESRRIALENFSGEKFVDSYIELIES